MTLRHEVVTIAGGGRAMRSLVDGEVMHPGVGPRVEAQTLYVAQARLAERLAAGALCLFDVGLGAGSNALAARAVGEARGGLRIVSFERDTDALEVALDHPGDFGLDGEPGQAARTLLQVGRVATAQTDWQLRVGDVLQALAEERERADVIFWDPFSPRANPSLWTVGAFLAARRSAQDGCLLITYSASTATRVALLLAGWTVGVGAPIGTKAQTTIACLGPPSRLAHPLTRAWLPRLSLPSAPLPSDAPPDAARAVSELAQFAAAT